jgi:DtxR family Mn-dependent transcriptional regulator
MLITGLGKAKGVSVAKERQIVSRTGPLSESLEDYLEAIMHIEEEKRAARPKDIALHLGVSPPSVTAALQNLGSRGLVNYHPYDLVTLTPRGRRIARDVIRRHEGLRRFFIDILRIDEDEADRVACDMEHSVPPQVMDRLLTFIDFIADSPHGGLTWSPQSGFGLRSSGGTQPGGDTD